MPAWSGTAAVLGAYLALSFLLFAAVWAHPTAVLAGNQEDSGPHVFFVDWPAYALGHGHNPLLSTWVGAPHGINLGWNTPVFVQSLLAWPITALAGPVVAFNLVITLGPALTAFVSFLAIRRYVPNRVAAAAGGLLVGFSPYLIAHAAAGHANQVTAAGAPLLLLILDSLLVRQRARAWLLGLALGAVAALIVYSGVEEVLSGAVVMAAVGLAVLAAVAPASLRTVMAGRMRRRLAQALLVAVPTFLLLAGPFLWYQFLGPQHLAGAVRPTNRYVTDLANLVVPTHIQAVAPAATAGMAAHFSGNLGEAVGYLGLPLILALVAVTVSQWRRLVVRWAALTALVAVVLSLGPTLHVAGHDTRVSLPWRLMARLPLFDNAEAVRYMLFAFLLAGLLVAIGVEALMRERDRHTRAGGVALLALSAVALAPALPLASRPTAIPAFFTSAAVQKIAPGSVAYLLPSVKPDTLLWQAVAGLRFRMVGGWYLGPDERGHVRQGPLPTRLSNAVGDIEASGDIFVATPADLTAYRSELHSDGVQSIIVTPYEPYETAVARFFSMVTGTPPQDDRAGTLYWTGLHL